jgi:hypothetical protein
MSRCDRTYKANHGGTRTRTEACTLSASHCFCRVTPFVSVRSVVRSFVGSIALVHAQAGMLGDLGVLGG